MNFEEAADELYAGSPEVFVERRSQLVAAARAARERELVRRLGQLRRPTRTAWLLNLLARAEPARIAELLSLGPALQDAQRRMAGDDLRRLSRDRRSMIDSLSRCALQLGREQEYTPPDTALQEVSQTLQAALGDPAVGDLLRRGRLARAENYGGFGSPELAALLGAGPTAAQPTDPAPSAEPSARSAEQTAAAQPEGGPGPRAEEVPATDEAAAARAAELARDAAAAQAAAAQAAAAQAEALLEARRALDVAQAESEAATTRADELAEEVEALRSRLRAAEAREREAREEARAARRRYQELRHASATQHAMQSAGQ